ncbi:RusA family crossover junction endodeoxyribonuclease [Azoarcus sp. L1K30]|uniref:RusA family crossover junction endodeoxyribonuclease n=1 Tax=Azoarcus sp. L1K30 TaxID=2820277 RepID=UPI001B80FD31|nr:RusA family crossover junction endodeoxyribonuclease [Azoarcus sp. L1K30]MBR0568378.1 RusA family crossover junction endodeoxyribonuclease [Azoarcus sp. L1K30]
MERSEALRNAFAGDRTNIHADIERIGIPEEGFEEKTAQKAFKSISLVLPYPISANRYWRTYMPKGFKAPVTVVSTEAKAYKQEVAWLAKAAGVRKPFEGRVDVEIMLFPKRPKDWEKRARRDPMGWDDTVQCIDLDNANKVIFDALKGVAFENDDWVHRITSERMEPDGNGRVEVKIRPYVRATAQHGLFDGE